MSVYYGLLNSQGYWVGIWNERGIAELVMSKLRDGERIVELVERAPALPAPATQENVMQWVCQKLKNENGWTVEAVGSDYECYVTRFYGPDAEQRAEEYTAFKNTAPATVSVPDVKPFVLTGMQIKHLHDACGGDFECEMSLAHFDECPDANDPPNMMPAGLYCWFTDYPQEGRILLPDDAMLAAREKGE